MKQNLFFLILLTLSAGLLLITAACDMDSPYLEEIQQKVEQDLGIAEYALSFSKNHTEATGTMSSESLKEGESLVLGPCSFSRVDWTFIGWALSPAGNVVYVPGDSLTMPAEDTVLYARWEEGFAVTFLKNDDQATGTMAPLIIPKNSSASLTPCAFQKTGYRFTGWAISSGGDVAYVNGGNYDMGVAPVNLYACWQANTYTVAFEPRGGSSVAEKSVTYDAPYGSLMDSSRDYYTFSGWWTGSEGTGTAVTADTTVQTGSDHILYAGWNPIEYSITYHHNGGIAGTPNPAEFTVETATFSLNPAVQYGHAFEGWYDNSGLSGSPVVEIPQGSHGDRQYYADWTEGVYTVTLNKQSGTGGTDAVSATFEDPMPAATAPERAGFRFSGYYDTADGQGVQYYDSDMVSATTWDKEDSALYAFWERWTTLSEAGDSDATGYGIAAPGDGTLWVCGETRGPIEGQSLTGDIASFLIQYSNTGEPLWSDLRCSEDGFFKQTKGRALTLDSEGNIYVAGKTNQSLDGQTDQGTKTGAFVMKYNADKSWAWTRVLGGADGDNEALGVAVDGSGNIYVCGVTEGSIEGETPEGFKDLFLAKYSSSGNLQWVTLFGETGEDTVANDVAVDGSGIYITGITGAALEEQTPTGDKDIFLMKYDTNGTRLWGDLTGSPSVPSSGKSIAVDTSGNIIVAGETSGPIDGETHHSPGYTNIALLKYSSSGTKLWTRLLGSDYHDSTYAVDIDSGGNIYVGGKSSEPLAATNPDGENDAFVAQYSPAGTQNWVRTTGAGSGEGASAVRGIAADDEGNAYATGGSSGDFNGEIRIGTGKPVFVTSFFNSP